jgi:hypothetical protein
MCPIPKRWLIRIRPEEVGRSMLRTRRLSLFVCRHSGHNVTKVVNPGRVEQVDGLTTLSSGISLLPAGPVSGFRSLRPAAAGFCRTILIARENELLTRSIYGVQVSEHCSVPRSETRCRENGAINWILEEWRSCIPLVRTNLSVKQTTNKRLTNLANLPTARR